MLYDQDVKVECECCKKLSVFLQTGICDDCQYLKIRMKRDPEITMKLLKEIKNEEYREKLEYIKSKGIKLEVKNEEKSG